MSHKWFLGCVFSGGREIRVCGQNLDVVQTPRIRVTVATRASGPGPGLERRRRVVPETACSPSVSCGGLHVRPPMGVSHLHRACHHPAQPWMAVGGGHRWRPWPPLCWPPPRVSSVISPHPSSLCPSLRSLAM